MSIRACIYKDCDNYVADNVPCGTRPFTIFRFPKSEERRQQWMKLGEVLPTIPERLWYMCSDHFDSKYLIMNSRRTTLVSTAVPNAYSASACNSDSDMPHEMATTTESLDMDADEVVVSIQSQLYEDDSQEGHEIQVLKNGVRVVDSDLKETEYCVASTTMQEDNVLLKQDGTEETEEEIDEYEVSCDYDDEQTTERVVQQPTRRVVAARAVSPEVKRRKITQTSMPPQAASKIRIKSMITSAADLDAQIESKLQLLNANQAKTPEKTERMTYAEQNSGSSRLKIDAKSLIDAEHVTVFIFKGEEYVQMPKQHYVREKLELMQKLKQYENALLSFKQRLNALNLP